MSHNNHEESFIGYDRRWEEIQLHLQKRIEYSKITHGTEVDLELLKILAVNMPGGDLNVVNVGSGDGSKAILQAKAINNLGVNSQYFGVDVNRAGVERSNEIVREESINWQLGKEPKFVVGNVTDQSFINNIGGDGSAGLVVAEGLFCNLLGLDSEYATWNLGQLLAPGGYFIVTDCVHVLDYDSRIMLKEKQNELELTDKAICHWEAWWIKRYWRNHLALRTKISDYTFVVMPPGENKQKMEYAESRKILSLVEAGEIERFARHWDKQETINMFAKHKMLLLDWQPRIWKSRAGEPLLGMQAVFQKIGNQKIDVFQEEMSIKIPN